MQKRRPYETVKNGVLFRDVPLALYQHWKAICAKRGVSLKEAFCKFLKEEVRKDKYSKTRLQTLEEQQQQESQKNTEPEIPPEESGNFLTPDDEEQMNKESDW